MAKKTTTTTISYENTVVGRNTLFAAMCLSFGLTPKWEPAEHNDHSNGRPSVSMAGHVMGAVAHVLCNKSNTSDIAALFENNPTLEGVTRQDLYHSGTSYRNLGSKGGHKSVTVAGSTDASTIVDTAEAARKALKMKGCAPTMVHTHKQELRESVTALNASVKEELTAREALVQDQLSAKAAKRAADKAAKAAKAAADAAAKEQAGATE